MQTFTGAMVSFCWLDWGPVWAVRAHLRAGTKQPAVSSFEQEEFLKWEKHPPKTELPLNPWESPCSCSVFPKSISDSFHLELSTQSYQRNWPSPKILTSDYFRFVNMHNKNDGDVPVPEMRNRHWKEVNSFLAKVFLRVGANAPTLLHYPSSVRDVPILDPMEVGAKHLSTTTGMCPEHSQVQHVGFCF